MEPLTRNYHYHAPPRVRGPYAARRMRGRRFVAAPVPLSPFPPSAPAHIILVGSAPPPHAYRGGGGYYPPVVYRGPAPGGTGNHGVGGGTPVVFVRREEGRGPPTTPLAAVRGRGGGAGRVAGGGGRGAAGAANLSRAVGPVNARDGNNNSSPAGRTGQPSAMCSSETKTAAPEGRGAAGAATRPREEENDGAVGNNNSKEGASAVRVSSGVTGEAGGLRSGQRPDESPTTNKSVSRELSRAGEEGKQWLAKNDDATSAANAAGWYGLGYISFLCIGFNSLVNWIFVMQTLPFIAPTQLKGEDWNNSLLGLFQAVEVFVLLFMLYFGSTSVLWLCTAGLVNAITAVIFPVLTVNNFLGRKVKIVMLHILCIVLGGCSAVLQGSGFALASVMPRNFVGAVSAGQGLAGAFTFAVVTLASFVWFEIETVQGTKQLVWLVFSIAALTSIACTGLFYSAMRQTWAAAALREFAVAAARGGGRAGEGERERSFHTDEDEDEEEEEEEEDDDVVVLDNAYMGRHAVSSRNRGRFAGRGRVLRFHQGGSSASTMPTVHSRGSQASGGNWGGRRTNGIGRNDNREKRELLTECLGRPGGRPAELDAAAERTAAYAASDEEEENGEEVSRVVTEDEEGRSRRPRRVTVKRQRKNPLVRLLDLKNRFVLPGKKEKKKDAPPPQPLQKPEGDIEQQGGGEAAAETAAENQENNTKQLTRWKVFKQAAPWLFILMLHMFITFHLYPKVGPLSWNYSRLIVRNHLVVLFGLFCAVESFGRFLPDLRYFRLPSMSCLASSSASSSASTAEKNSSDNQPEGEKEDHQDDNPKSCCYFWFNWMMLSRRALVVCEMARLLLFVPFILGYVMHDVPVINNFAWYCFLIIVLSLTQGWMGTLSFYYSVSSVSDPEAKKFTGPLAAIASPLGCMIGLYTAAPY